MANPVTVTMPLELTSGMLRAVRDHDTTKTEDREEWHRRLGWLLCAWDVLVSQRLPPEVARTREQFEEEVRMILASTPHASEAARKVADLVW